MLWEGHLFILERSRRHVAFRALPVTAEFAVVSHGLGNDIAFLWDVTGRDNIKVRCGDSICESGSVELFTAHLEREHKSAVRVLGFVHVDCKFDKSLSPGFLVKWLSRTREVQLGSKQEWV